MLLSLDILNRLNLLKEITKIQPPSNRICIQAQSNIQLTTCWAFEFVMKIQTNYGIQTQRLYNNTDKITREV